MQQSGEGECMEMCWLFSYFLSASNPPFYILLCDAKAKNLQTTFFHWSLGLCQILPTGVQEEDQKSGQTKKVNAGSPLDTLHALA